MLEPSEWSSLLSSIPERWQSLRRPAREEDLRRIERSLGRRLPASFRNFLLAGDGGYVGGARVLGTAELERTAPEGLPPGLLPIHPVGDGYECLDLRNEASVDALAGTPEEAPVVWWSPGGGTRRTYVDFTDWMLDQMIEAVADY